MSKELQIRNSTAEFLIELLFRVTRIGCGIAGFTNEEIAPLFKAAYEMENVSLPNGWRELK